MLYWLFIFLCAGVHKEYSSCIVRRQVLKEKITLCGDNCIECPRYAVFYWGSAVIWAEDNVWREKEWAKRMT